MLRLTKKIRDKYGEVPQGWDSFDQTHFISPREMQENAANKAALLDFFCDRQSSFDGSTAELTSQQEPVDSDFSDRAKLASRVDALLGQFSMKADLVRHLHDTYGAAPAQLSWDEEIDGDKPGGVNWEETRSSSSLFSLAPIAVVEEDTDTAEIIQSGAGAAGETGGAEA